MYIQFRIFFFCIAAELSGIISSFYIFVHKGRSLKNSPKCWAINNTHEILWSLKLQFIYPTLEDQNVIIEPSTSCIYPTIFLISRGGGGGVQTGATRYVGHWMAYCTCPGWLWWWRIWWNGDWQGKPKYSEKTCPSATLPTTIPTWPDPGANPGRRGGKPATNRLSGVAAYILSCPK
jgi:hypothetical protein